MNIPFLKSLKIFLLMIKDERTKFIEKMDI